MSDFDVDAYISDHEEPAQPAPAVESSGGGEFDVDSYIEDHAEKGPETIGQRVVPPIIAGVKSAYKTITGDESDYEGDKAHALKQMKDYAASHANVVEGSAPLAIPGAAAPKLLEIAEKVAGSVPGRLATSAVSGFATGATSGPEGQSLGERFDRGVEGGKQALTIQGGLETLPYIGKALKFGGKKIASTITGVSEKDISTYAKHTDEVNKMIKESGGEVTEAADQLREKVSKGIQSFKSKLSGQISGALKSSPKEPTIKVDGIIKHLEESKKGLDPVYKADAIREIEEEIAKIRIKAPNGLVNAQDLNVIKSGLQDAASSSYSKGGQLFSRGTDAQRAAKGAGAIARKTLNAVSPEIAQANNQLSALHTVEANLNKNLITAGKSDSALLAAGSGGNNRNAKMLQRLGDISGVDALGAAEKLSAVRQFGKAGLTPEGTTGKTLTRAMFGTGAGAAVGSIAGPIGAAIGAGVGGAVASPAALKVAINAANVAKPVTNAVGTALSAARNNPVIAQTAIGRLQNQIKENNQETKEIEPISPPSLGEEAPELPILRGENKWAAKGAEKLGIDRELASKLVGNKQARRLLIEASDLPAGSKKLESILKRISELEN
jgi:hypothetical protein